MNQQRKNQISNEWEEMELPELPVERRGFKAHKPEKEAIGLLQILPLTRTLDDEKLTRFGVWISPPTEGSADLKDAKFHRLLAVAVGIAIAIVRSAGDGWIKR